MVLRPLTLQVLEIRQRVEHLAQHCRDGGDGKRQKGQALRQVGALPQAVSCILIPLLVFELVDHPAGKNQSESWPWSVENECPLLSAFHDISYQQCFPIASKTKPQMEPSAGPEGGK